MNIFELHERMTGHLFPAYSNTDERSLPPAAIIADWVCDNSDGDVLHMPTPVKKPKRKPK